MIQLITGWAISRPRTDDRLGRGTGDFKIPERYSLSAGYESNKADAIAYNVGVDLSQEDLGASDISGSAGITWRPDDCLLYTSDAADE